MKSLFRHKILISICLVCIFSHCKDNPTENKEYVVPSNFMPEGNSIDGWVPNLETGNWLEIESTVELEFFLGEQSIQAATVIEHNFIRAAKQVYDGRIAGANETLEVRIFDFEFSNQSEGFYHNKAIIPSKYDFLDTQICETGRISITGSDNIITIDFYYDKWYAWISINGRWGAYEAKQIAIQFTAQIYENMLRLYPVDY